VATPGTIVGRSCRAYRPEPVNLWSMQRVRIRQFPDLPRFLLCSAIWSLTWANAYLYRLVSIRLGPHTADC
jgi:hypothetical protein